MSERAGRGRVCRALACALLGGAGCLQDDGDSIDIGVQPEYELGGQTGSLLPRCGVAPLSAQGQSVPVGRVLGVFYGEDCRDVAAGRVELFGAGVEGLALDLVPLEGDAYLLQAPESVPAGDYQLQLDTQGSSALRVADGERMIPAVFGALSSVSAAECPELLRFNLELDEAALALAPLARFEVRIDGGAEQLWVDYGALRIERDETGARGVLELPRCGVQGCLSAGPHFLELRVRIAGESREPEPIEHYFEPCPALEPPAEESGCALSSPRRANGAEQGLLPLGWALALCWWRRGAAPRRARGG